MKLDFDKARPIYKQIISEIKKMIVRGELNPGDKLPSQRKMARKVDVNPNTIQRVYREMESMNLVESRRGKGTFVREDMHLMEQIKKEMAQTAVDRFIGEMKSLGFDMTEINKLIEEKIDEGSD